MRIYTRTGDKGETGLLGSRRVSKASLRIEAYGTVDELNAALGVVISKLDDAEAEEIIERVQNELHIICADLAALDPAEKVPHIQAEHVKGLEELCDKISERLSPLEKFILPGGTPAGALLHWARTVARRAERRVVQLAAKEEVNPEVIRYLNRLSDLLFLLARWENHRAGISETSPRY